MNHNSIREIAEDKRSTWLQVWFDLLGEPELNCFGETLQVFDKVLVKQPVEPLQERGIAAEYFDAQGCPADLPAIWYDQPPAFDVVLFGDARPKYKQRHRDVRALVDAGFKVAWCGDSVNVKGVTSLPWLVPHRLPSFMSMGKLTLCVDLTHDVRGYYSDRLWLALGAGACVVRRFTEGQPELSYLSYRSTHELVGLVRRMLEQPLTRKAYGDRAREQVMQNHTIEHRAQDLSNGRFTRSRILHSHSC